MLNLNISLSVVFKVVVTTYAMLTSPMQNIGYICGYLRSVRLKFDNEAMEKLGTKWLSTFN